MGNIWVTAKCPECGDTFKYTKDQIYKPHTCGKYDCVHKFAHRPDYLEMIRKIDAARVRAFTEK